MLTHSLARNSGGVFHDRFLAVRKVPTYTTLLDFCTFHKLPKQNKVARSSKQATKRRFIQPPAIMLGLSVHPPVSSPVGAFFSLFRKLPRQTRALSPDFLVTSRPWRKRKGWAWVTIALLLVQCPLAGGEYDVS